MTFLSKDIKAICIVILLIPIIGYGIVDTYAYDYPTPEGYNDNDYQKLLRFYLNGNQHLKWNISDPSKWHGVTWEGSPNKNVVAISLNDCQISGELDLSDFLKIISVEIADNEITHLNVNNCPDISMLFCNNNQINWIAGLSKLNPSAYIFTDGNLNMTNVVSAISTSEIIDSFKSGGDSLFVLSEAITLESKVFNSIPFGYRANFTIVDSDDKFLYEWNLSHVPPTSYDSNFNLKAEFTSLNTDSSIVTSLKLAGSPPPFARLKIDVSEHYNDGELLFIYKHGNDCCNNKSMSSSQHSLTNLASYVEVSNGIIDFVPTGEDIILSNAPIEIEDSTTPTTTTTTTSTTTSTTSATTSNIAHLTSATSVTNSKIDDDSNAGNSSSQFDTSSELQDEYTKTSVGNSNNTNPASNIVSEDADRKQIKESNPSTYGRVGLLFLPFMLTVVFYLSLYNKGQTK